METDIGMASKSLYVIIFADGSVSDFAPTSLLIRFCAMFCSNQSCVGQSVRSWVLHVKVDCSKERV